MPRENVESTTDAEARLYKKALPDKAVPSYQGHALIDPTDEDLSTGPAGEPQRVDRGS